MSADEPDTLAAARAEVERTREELGETVEALAYKADVKSRAKDKLEEVRAEADDATVQAKGTAEAAGDRVRQLPPAVLAGIGVAAAALVVLTVVLRRRS